MSRIFIRSSQRNTFQNRWCDYHNRLRFWLPFTLNKLHKFYAVSHFFFENFPDPCVFFSSEPQTWILCPAQGNRRSWRALRDLSNCSRTNNQRRSEALFERCLSLRSSLHSVAVTVVPQLFHSANLRPHTLPTAWSPCASPPFQENWQRHAPAGATWHCKAWAIPLENPKWRGLSTMTQNRNFKIRSQQLISRQ